MKFQMSKLTKLFVTAVILLNPISTLAAERGEEMLEPNDGTVASENNALNEKAEDVTKSSKNVSDKISNYIHDQLISEDSLSKDAKNVKIQTSSKTVVLNGIVDSQSEKVKVESIAKKIAVNRSLQSQLQVKQ